MYTVPKGQQASSVPSMKAAKNYWHRKLAGNFDSWDQCPESCNYLPCVHSYVDPVKYNNTVLMAVSSAVEYASIYFFAVIVGHYGSQNKNNSQA